MDDKNHASPIGEFLTIDDICGLFTLTRATVEGWLDSGELAHYRLGPRTIRIKRADLEAFLEARRRVGEREIFVPRGGNGGPSSESDGDIRSRCSASPGAAAEVAA